MINFPNFGIYLNISPVAFYIGNFAFYYYGLIMAFALLCGCIVLLKLAAKKKLDGNNFIDCICWVIPSAVIGARAYFVISNYKDYHSFYDIINFRQGGIAIYGAVIGGALAVYLFCKKKRESFLSYADCFAPALILGQAIGRWGNFFNSEAYGREYFGLFRMEVLNKLGHLISVHPTFLYESVWCLAGFVLLIIIFKESKKIGTPFFSYLIWYGFGRFFIEGLRIDSLPYGASFKISQYVSLAIILVGIIALIRSHKKCKESQ